MKKIMTGNRKYKKRRIAAAAGAGLTAAAVLITAVLGRPIDAEAADTLIGIEKLRSEVKESGRDYVVVEIVPDKSAAEIGYLFDGYEPILGDWNEDGEWQSWKDILIETKPEERVQFIAGEKEKLKKYYELVAGFDTSEDELPVKASDDPYDEKSEPTPGYEKITSSGETKDGWFDYCGDRTGQYQVRFEQAIYTGSASETKNFKPFEAGATLYYKATNPISISQWLEDNNKTAADIIDDNILDDAFVYVRSMASNVERFSSPKSGKTWGAIKSSVVVSSNGMGRGEDVVDPDDGNETDDGDDSGDDGDDDDGDDSGDDGDDDDGDDSGDDDGDGDDNGDNGDDGDDGDDDGDDNGDDDGDENGGNGGSGTGDGTNEGDTVAQQSRWFKLVLDDEPSNTDSNDDDSDGNSDSTDDNNTDNTGDNSDTGDNNSGDGDGDENGDDDNGDGDGTEDDDGYADDPDSDDETSDDEDPDGEWDDDVTGSYAASSYNLDQIFFVQFEKLSAEDYISIHEGHYGNVQLYAVQEIVKSGTGMYKFSDLPENSDGITYMTYHLPGDTIYCQGTFTSNEWFKKYVINLDKKDYDNFNVKVLVYTPEELNAMSADELKNLKFDFLYLNSGLRNVNTGSNTAGGDTVYGGSKDLEGAIGKALYDTVIGKRIPCLVDGSILYAQGAGDAENISGGIVTNNDLKNTEIFKLSAMLCQENFGGNYGNLTPEKMIDGIVDDADKNFVVEHVYCRYGDGKDSIINDQFNVATIYKEGGDMSPGFQKVLDEILLENQYREADSSGNYKKLSTDISQAKAVRHILNYVNRRKVETKKHIRVLEIQPARADKPELTLEQLKKWAPGVESADITSMTTAEFIGKIEKLNENYDLIYIGTSKDHLNMRYWMGDKDYNSKGKPDAKHVPAGTVFNDVDMDGLIYYNIGDLRVTSMALAGQLDSEYHENGYPYYYNYVRYPGNDITEEKKEALLSFLDGSYPIVVADDFFESPVTVYDEAGYAGAHVNLAEGDYNYITMEAAGVPRAAISSVKVKEGYQVTFHNGWFLEDDPDNVFLYQSVDKDVSDLGSLPFDGWRFDTWDNAAHSLKVERISEDVPPRTIDEDHIDNCTYMYEFVKEAMNKKYVNFYAWSDITDESELFKFYLNRPKVSLSDITVNGLRKEGSDIYYVEAGVNDKYNLQYSFTIRNEGAASYDTRYQCKLYIDINSDGKFSEQEEIPDVSLTQGGGNVSSNDLYADRQYVLAREVPAGYKGLLPWKVEITQADNPNIYTSVTGYSKLEGVEQEKITVLQIARNPMWPGEPIFDLGAEIESDGTIYNTLVHGGTYNGVAYDGIDKDFDIDITYKTIAEFEQEYLQNNDYLDDFNMLMLGYNDMYGDFTGDSETGPMGAIVDFINSGKSVLFAHDTTSFINYPSDKREAIPWRNNGDDRRGNAEVYQAATLNKYVRPLVGMDRYGVLSSSILKKGNWLSEGSSEFAEVVSSRYDKAYKPKSGKKQLVPQVHGYTYLIISGKDQEANTGNYSDGGYDKKEFNRWEIDLSKNSATWKFSNNYRNIRYDEVFYKLGYSDYGEVSAYRGKASPQINSWGEVDNLWVTQVNQGQITEYPYHLDETFEIAETHGQYYQLDYTADDDGDGESDLVVWFCLDKRGGNQETVYSQSPNDVRNNYYIYNKGNITYTGMGHSVQRNPVYTVDEAKLFINTIIAAYQAGIKDPYITVLKRGVPESEELKMMYRYYDMKGDTVSLDDEAATETYEKVYFTVQDINFVKGTRRIASRVFYETDEGSDTITVGGKDITVNRIDDAMFKASDDSPVAADNLLSGGVYYILVPRTVLKKCDKENGLDIYFEAQTTLTTNTTKVNVYETGKVYAKLKVLQAYMFNLE